MFVIIGTSQLIVTVIVISTYFCYNKVSKFVTTAILDCSAHIAYMLPVATDVEATWSIHDAKR